MSSQPVPCDWCSSEYRLWVVDLVLVGGERPGFELGACCSPAYEDALEAMRSGSPEELEAIAAWFLEQTGVAAAPFLERLRDPWGDDPRP